MQMKIIVGKSEKCAPGNKFGKTLKNENEGEMFFFILLISVSLSIYDC